MSNKCFCDFWAYGSCPDALVTFSIIAPAHPQATRVAVYPALLVMNSKEKSPKVSNDLLKETAIEWRRVELEKIIEMVSIVFLQFLAWSAPMGLEFSFQ